MLKRCCYFFVEYFFFVNGIVCGGKKHWMFMVHEINDFTTAKHFAWHMNAMRVAKNAAWCTSLRVYVSLTCILMMMIGRGRLHKIWQNTIARGLFMAIFLLSFFLNFSFLFFATLVNSSAVSSASDSLALKVVLVSHQFYDAFFL